MSRSSGQDTRAPAPAASTSGLTSGGVPIEVEWFEAEATGQPRPAVLMLHGADGLVFAERYREGARQMAEAGYPTALVHYLDRTGERRVTFASLHQNFERWTATVRDALGWLAQRPGVDPDRLAVVGVSLGAALALHAADPRIKALIDYFGPMPSGVDQLPRLPPTLILHGALDRLVPPSDSRELAALLERRSVPHELVIYPDQGHGFHGPAHLDAGRRGIAFLQRHLP